MSYKDTPTRTAPVDVDTFAYRELGPKGGVPLVFLNHLAAVLDNWDPRIVDGLATGRQVITFDNRGVGASTGSAPDAIETMAHDAVAFIQALGLTQVDLLGLSMGGSSPRWSHSSNHSRFAGSSLPAPAPPEAKGSTRSPH
jgi:pimeloyl-ACP methyl ester carboxylesterase